MTTEASLDWDIYLRGVRRHFSAYSMEVPRILWRSRRRHSPSACTTPLRANVC